MSQSNRREFMEQAAGAMAITSLPPARRRVLGANDRINLAFIGTGMRFGGLVIAFDPVARKVLHEPPPHKEYLPPVG